MLDLSQLRWIRPSGRAIAIGLALAPVIALGFTRFAYALLLPPMKSNLHWTYTQAGGMNAGNAAGYIAGAVTAAWAARRLSAGRAFVWSLSVSALALLLSGVTTSYASLIALRAVGGYTTAVAFVVGSALAARLRPSLLPIYFAGPGAGIVVSSVVVPAALGHGPSNGWKLGWIVLGAIASVAVLGAWRAEAHVPGHQGHQAATLTLTQFRRLGWLLAGYVLFGGGYVSFMTFVIELLRDRGVGNWTSASFFLVLGATSAVSTLFWGHPLKRLSGGRGLAVVSVATLLGTIPVLVHANVATAFVSAVIFGASFMAGPTAVTAFCRRCLPADAWAAGIAILTTGFAVGQAVGPIVSGAISDHAGGGVRAGLWLSPAVLALAAAVAAVQGDHSPEAAVVDETEEIAKAA